MRISLGHSLVSGLFAIALAAGCEAKSSPGLEYVPEDASLVIGVDLGALETWPPAERSSLHRRIPGLETLASASERCGVPLEKAAAHLAVGESLDHVLMVVSAPGVAKASTLRCALDVADLASTLRVDESGEGTVLVRPDDGDAVVGIARNDDLLVVAGPSWRDRLDAEPTPAGAWHRSARPQNTVWFAGRSPTFLPASLGVDATRIQSITGYLEIDTQGLDLVATVTAVDEASTEPLQQSFAELIDTLGPALYLPPRAVEALAPRIDGTRIVWDAELDRRTVDSLDARWLDAIEAPAAPPPSLADAIEAAMWESSSPPAVAPEAVVADEFQLDPELRTGIASCDEYTTKYLRCMQTKFPDAATTVHDALARAAKAWRDSAASMGTFTVEETCRAVLVEAENALRTLGCED